MPELHHPPTAFGQIASQAVELLGLSRAQIAFPSGERYVAIALGAGRPARAGARMTVPIEGARGVYGQFAVERPPSFDASDRARLERLADLAAGVIDHEAVPPQLAERLRDDARSLARRLAERTGLSTPAELETSLISDVADRLGATAQQAADARLAAQLVELGSVGAGAARPRSDEAVCAAAAVAHVPGFERVATVVRHMGERWDGRGRPDGLAGDRIPRASRIARACREFRVLISERPAGAGLEAAAAIELMTGVHDPAVIGTLEASLRRVSVAPGA